MANNPLMVLEDIHTTPRRELFTLFGVRWTVTPYAWVGVIVEIIFGMIAALVTGNSLVVGVLWGILIVVSLTLHSIGHILGGLYVGSPMDEVLVTASRQVNIYRNDPPNLPSRVHLGRALGGPLMNIVVGAITLILTALGGGATLLFFAAVNLVWGLGALLPLPSVDGEVIWRELRR